jgi:hypothetical protein
MRSHTHTYPALHRTQARAGQLDRSLRYSQEAVALSEK